MIDDHDPKMPVPVDGAGAAFLTLDECRDVEEVLAKIAADHPDLAEECLSMRRLLVGKRLEAEQQPSEPRTSDPKCCPRRRSFSLPDSWQLTEDARQHVEEALAEIENENVYARFDRRKCRLYVSPTPRPGYDRLDALTVCEDRGP